MKGFLAMFTLTPREQRLVIFVVLALVAGVSIKHRRDNELNEKSKLRGIEPSLQTAVSPTPPEQ